MIFKKLNAISQSYHVVLRKRKGDTKGLNHLGK